MRKVLGLSAVIMILFLMGCGEETIDLEGESVTYEELQQKINNAESKFDDTEGNLKKLEQDLKDVENKISSREADFKNLENKYKTEVEGFEEIVALIDDKESIEDEIKTAESKLKTVNSQIASAEGELNKLQGQIVKAADEPLKVSAGYYYFGSDVEPGRYELRPQEGHYGNVFIRRDGRSYVAETFGPESRGGTTSFVFESTSGDEIEATIPIYLYPVE